MEKQGYHWPQTHWSSFDTCASMWSSKNILLGKTRTVSKVGGVSPAILMTCVYLDWEQGENCGK